MDKQGKVNNRNVLGKKIWSLQSQGDTATLLPQYNTQTHTCYNSETKVLQQQLYEEFKGNRVEYTAACFSVM